MRDVRIKDVNPLSKYVGNCVKCDGYDMCCYNYTAYHPKILSPCVTKWNMGETIDDRVN